MSIILRHELQCGDAEYCTVIIHLDPFTPEFSEELDSSNSIESKTFKELIQQYINKEFPNVKIGLVKIMIGSIVVASMSMPSMPTVFAADGTTANQSAYTNYTVAAGDTLWIISGKFHVSVSDIKTANNMTTDTIYMGQVLKIPQFTTALQPQTNYTTYTVVSGDTLFLIAQRFGSTISSLKSLNNLTTDTIYLGQKLKIPVSTTAPTTTTTVNTSSYTVTGGDTLWILSQRFSTTVDELRRLNRLTTDVLYIGQILRVPASTGTLPAPSTQPTISYKTHTVVSGDNTWNLSIKYGIPMTELLNVNGLTQSSVLSIGQTLRIPVHNIPIKPTPGPQYGERLDWWTEAQYVFPINKTARVIDFATGRSFMIKRTIGANHADSEPLTAADAAIIKEVWGGAYSWTARAVIVEVDGRRIAGSMASMPHDIEYITDNNFTGHFDLHFLNSTRHKDGLVDPYHQAQIDISSGYAQK